MEYSDSHILTSVVYRFLGEETCMIVSELFSAKHQVLRHCHRSLVVEIEASDQVECCVLSEVCEGGVKFGSEEGRFLSICCELKEQNSIST